jgi:anti-sigma factor RsiW
VNCTACVAQLTAYLDGELTDERGAAMRGHLRTCVGCEQTARHEAAIRDGLRALPSVEPPAHLWAAIAAQVAQQEVAIAKQTSWQRWSTQLRGGFHAVARSLALPQLGRTGRWSATVAMVGAAAGLLWWRMSSHHESSSSTVITVPTLAGTQDAIPHRALGSNAVVRDDVAVSAHGLALAPSLAASDVAAELLAEQNSVDTTYATTISELQADVARVSSHWSTTDASKFAQRSQQLADAVRSAKDVRARSNAYRQHLRFLQSAAIEQVASIDSVMP